MAFEKQCMNCDSNGRRGDSRMSDSKALSTVPEADYEAIEGAVMETARGRWFLSEYARRNRSADTEMLLGAIGRIETLVQQDRETQEMDRLRFDLMEMAKAIARTKSEIASLRPPGSDSSELNVASEALDAIVRTTERATSDILEAAEHVQEAAWTLREEGGNEPMCDELDRRATDIYTACSFQDLTAQRTSRIVNTLRYLEGRINAMIEIWGSTEEADNDEDERRQPDLTESLDVFNGLSQADVDTFIVEKAQGEGESVVDAYFFDTDIPAGVHAADLPPVVGAALGAVQDETVAALPEIEEIIWSESPGTTVVDSEHVEEPEVPSEEEEEEEQPAEQLANHAVEEIAELDEAVEPEDLAEFEVLDEPEELAEIEALAELDTLDVNEKLRRFT